MKLFFKKRALANPAAVTIEVNPPPTFAAFSAPVPTIDAESNTPRVKHANGTTTGSRSSYSRRGGYACRDRATQRTEPDPMRSLSSA